MTKKNTVIKKRNSGKDPHNELDLIHNSPMIIGGRAVYGGYGTGKCK